MKMNDDDLDRILTNDHLSADMKMTALERHASQESGSTGCLAAVAALVLFGAAAYLIGGSADKNPAPQQVEQQSTTYSKPNNNYE